MSTSGPDGVAEGTDEPLDVPQQRCGDDLIRAAHLAAEAGQLAEPRLRLLARDDHVRFQGGKSPLHHLPPQFRDVGQRVDRRRADVLGVARPGGAAVRPVDADALAHRTTEQLDHRNTERLGRDIHEGALDTGNGLGGDAAGALPGAVHQVPDPPLVGAGVLAEQQGGQVLDGADDAVRLWRPAIATLAVPHHPSSVATFTKSLGRQPASTTKVRRS